MSSEFSRPMLVRFLPHFAGGFAYSERPDFLNLLKICLFEYFQCSFGGLEVEICSLLS